jgi:serine/threonine-protein kinase
MHSDASLGARRSRAGIERIPESISGYRVDGVLGRGGSGLVLRVWDEALERPLALKLLTDDFDEEARARFMVEARAAGRIVHANVVQVYSVGVYEGRAYIIQELVEGHPLSSLLEVRGRLSPQAVIDIGVQAAKGLARASEVGVLHRDVKPQNLLVTDEGLVKLADFGLAKLLHSPSALTNTGTTLGTPHYMSPEQGLAQDLDARSDQYSLGATLYHLLTGRAPFDSDNALALLLKHVQEPLVPIREVEPSCPAALAEVVQRMLSKNRADRFESFDLVMEALESIDLDPVEGVESEAPPGQGAALVSLAASAKKDQTDELLRGPEGSGLVSPEDVSPPEVAAEQPDASGGGDGLRDRLLIGLGVAAAIAVILVAFLGGGRPRTTVPEPMAEAAEAGRHPAAEPVPVPDRKVEASVSAEAATDPKPNEDQKPPKVPPTRLEALIADLGEDRAVAERAIKELGALGDQGATMALVRVLESSPAPRLRAAAAQALGQLGDTRALPPLRRAAQHGMSPLVRKAAKEAADRLFAVDEDDEGADRKR